ncbi:MAG: class I SAM-dependent methyltransferase [Candidatus Saccharimonadales bacterium]
MKAITTIEATRPSDRKHKRADQYNQLDHNYLQYWQKREYENAAEVIAIKRLLTGKHFNLAVDIGGGYGRLSILLVKYADKVILADPSKRQLKFADDFLKEQPGIERQLMQADDLKFKDQSVDLVVMVRVLHHIPSPRIELAEIARILNDKGYAIIEIANYGHALNHIKHLVRGKRLPVKPVDIRSPQNRTKDEIPFVNLNPHTFVRQLAHAGLRVERTLSVSNLRNPGLKKVVPLKAMLGLERALQSPLARVYFGPSIFFLVKKSH